MFSYYGSKSKWAKLYPPPAHDTIIEPFAGSARYSLLYPERQVILFDSNPLIVDLWKYLIEATEKDILALPEIESKRSLDTIHGLTDTERALIGFHLCRGKAKPRKVGHGQNGWARDKVRIAGRVKDIKHWTVACLPYKAAPDLKATWFIDPPYQRTQVKSNGDRYPYGDDIDYGHLADYARSRQGQVIVCEGAGADWLPFTLLKEVTVNTNNTSSKKFGEYVYTT